MPTTTTVKSPADLFGATIRNHKAISKRAKDQILGNKKLDIIGDIEQYDRKYYDAVEGKAVIVVVHPEYGNTQIIYASRFQNDPWSALHWNEPGKLFFTWLCIERKWKEFTQEEAQEFLYIGAKDLGFSEIQEFNEVTGYMVTFNELVGSMPEYMRNAYEADEKAKETLKWYYESERDTILRYLTAHERRVEVINDDGNEVINNDGNKEWVTIPITKIAFQFNRFEPREKGSRQTKTFFSVSDISPNYNTKPRYNWFGQNTSRWMYAGAIVIDWFEGTEEGSPGTVRISINH